MSLQHVTVADRKGCSTHTNVQLWVRSEGKPTASKNMETSKQQNNDGSTGLLAKLQNKSPGGCAEEVAGKRDKSYLHRLTDGIGGASDLQRSTPRKRERAILQWRHLTATTSAT